MLYHFQRKKLCRHLMVGGALCAAGLAMFSCSDRFDLDEKQPSGLENIYGYMKASGNYTEYLHLIDDLGLAEILSKTGSKTMFIADDDAFAEFYRTNPWGVKDSTQLSLAQKKLLLNASMIDMPYTSTMLSSAQAVAGSGTPSKGEVCRRNTSQSILDSVLVFQGSDPDNILPQTPRFNELRANYADKDVVLFCDASSAPPMLHFTGQFVDANQLELTDIDFIYNQPEGTFHSDDIYVNNSRVTESNIFCKNGFVHKVDKVVMPLENMAEIIRKNPDMSYYSTVLERFAAPMHDESMKEIYNTYLKNQNIDKGYDTVFVKRYFSQRSAGSDASIPVPFSADKNGNTLGATLKYDPGWNSYVPDISNDRVAMMEDVAVMLVPSNEAIDEWWRNGVGKTLADYYHAGDGSFLEALEASPDTLTWTLADLINVNQLSSFAQSAPSRFNSVLNDANEKMGIEPGDVLQVFIGCNGLVFLTKKVFSPAKYESVLFPTSVDFQRFSTMSKIIPAMDYEYYLNSMVSKFIFLLPTNEGLLSFVDPVSYATPQQRIWEFHLDEKGALYVDVYKADKNEDGTYSIPLGATRETRLSNLQSQDVMTKKEVVTHSNVKNRLTELLDNNIIIEPYRPGKKYYITKGRTFVKVESDDLKHFDIQGSFQLGLNQPMPVSQSGEAYLERNGYTVALDGMAMGTPKSVLATLHDAVVPGIDSQNDSIFKKFYEIVYECARSTSNKKTGYGWQAADQTFGNLFKLTTAGLIGNEAGESDKATFLLNNYHYTIYAPTNDAMDEAFAAGLPTIEQLREADEWDKANHKKGTGATVADQRESRGDSLREVLLDFVKYHIQDNAIFVDVDTAGTFETGKTALIPAQTMDDEGNLLPWDGTYTPSRPYTVSVKVSGGTMTVTDCRKGYDFNTHAFLGGHTATVYTEEGACNLMAREYWLGTSAEITGTTNPTNINIDNSSAAVIHAINHPLFYATGTSYNSQPRDADDYVPSQFKYNYQPLSK